MNPNLVVSTPEELRTLIRSEVEALANSKVESPNQSSEWLSNSEARDMLGLSRSTLQKYRSQGKIPYAKLFGSIRYRRADLEDLLSRTLRVPENSGV